MLISAFGWYGALIGSGMIICIFLAYFMAKRRGYDADIIFNIAIVAIPCAIVGARLYYVFTDMAHGGHWPITKILGFENGKFVGFAGLAIYGGILGGIIGAIIVRLFNRKKPIEKQMTFIQMADLCFCLIILGQAIGRWGNFANGEAYGQLITNPKLQWFPFAVFIENPKETGQVVGWYHATFFYESLWNIIGFGLLQWFYNGKRKSFEGFYVSFYCVWYGFIRFWIEGLRSDSMYFGPIKANQLISAIIFLFGIGIIIYHIVMAKRSGKKPFLFVKEDELSPEYYGYEKSFFCLRKSFAANKSEAISGDDSDNSEVAAQSDDKSDFIEQSQEPEENE